MGKAVTVTWYKVMLREEKILVVLLYRRLTRVNKNVLHVSKYYPKRNLNISPQRDGKHLRC